MKTKTSPTTNSMSRSLLQCGLLVIPLVLACFVLSPTAQAQLSPPPDGGYPGGNTAEGDDALFSLTTGVFNTAIGLEALFDNTDGDTNTATGAFALRNNTIGSGNTANGVSALISNTTGDGNTATGDSALFSNTIASDNTATGSAALSNNTTGFANTANGAFALQMNRTGRFNTANGTFALLFNTIGSGNTANGVSALISNTTGRDNTANGAFTLTGNTTGVNNTATGNAALQNNTIGSGNTATGFRALFSNTTGNRNIAFGPLAGTNLTTGSNNIDIGNVGVAGESSTTRIGSVQTRTFIAGIRGRTTERANAIPVLIDTAGQLGTVSSSRRFKKEIEPMDQTSEAILALKPVTFHYKSDATGTPQFGLIAEEVAQVNPDLVVRDENGQIYTVRYDAVNAMLLNEFLKEHRTVQELKREITALTATVKEQAAQIQKVSAQIEGSKPAPQVVSNQ
jgi:hypothetical protein